MSAPIPVALLGFTNFERNALASYFRLSPRRSPSYVHVLDVDDARFVVADADQSGVPELLNTLGRTGDAVFIGAHGPEDGAAWMMRPIDPAQVLRELDHLLAARDNPSTGPLPLSTRSAAVARARGAMQAAAPERTPPTRRADDESSSPAIASERLAEAQARRARREAALRPVSVRRALMVDDSEVALAFLERQLHRHDIAADWAQTSEKAIELMSQRPYGMVFLDVDLGERSELDGLALCQHIKRRQVHPSGRTPVVVLVSAFNEPVDRVRGTLAGADGQLGKPLDTAALDRLLVAHGLAAQPTGPAPRAPR
ncbi:response regulator [Ideonella sp. A 288]|uniref:response regulator n=1 Tax=Ideonella sp. A 288 TaxID=1962181 RepID=UPI000B4C1B90|nr:response regulator [Ideonella sp. A 288]